MEPKPQFIFYDLDDSRLEVPMRDIHASYDGHTIFEHDYASERSARSYQAVVVDQSAVDALPVVDEFEIEDDVPAETSVAVVSEPEPVQQKPAPRTKRLPSKKGAIGASATVNRSCPDPSICAMRMRAFDDTDGELCGAHTALSVRRYLMVLDPNAARRAFVPLFRDFNGDLRPLCEHACRTSRQHFTPSVGKKFVRGVGRFFGLT